MITPKKLELHYTKDKDNCKVSLYNRMSLEFYSLGIYPTVEVAQKKAPQRLKDWLKYPPCEGFTTFVNTYNIED